MHTIPLFAAMSNPELMAFWYRYHRASRKDAAALVGHTSPGYTNQAASIANYACNMAVAMTCLFKGDLISVANYRHAALLSIQDLPNELSAACFRTEFRIAESGEVVPL